MPNYDEDLGYDDDDLGYDEDEMGIRMPWNRKKKSSKKVNPRVAMRRQIQEKALSGNVSPTVGRRLLGLGYSALTNAASSVILAATVQEMFRVRKPILAVKYGSTWASGLAIISDIKVGNKSQLLGTEEGPLDGLTGDAVDVNLMCDIANPGQEIAITIKYSGSTAPTATATTHAWVSAWVTGDSIG